MMNKKVVTSLAVLAIGCGVVSCGNQEVAKPVYTSDFVNALVAAKGLTAENEAYVFNEKFTDTAVNYNFKLTCKSNSSFKYIFNAELSKEVSGGAFTGTITSKIDFLWGSFKSSIFKGTADLKTADGKTTDTAEWLYYGFIFNSEAGTIANSCYSQTINGITDDFREVKAFDTAWNMTRINISHLNALVQEVVSINLW